MPYTQNEIQDYFNMYQNDPSRINSAMRHFGIGAEELANILGWNPQDIYTYLAGSTWTPNYESTYGVAPAPTPAPVVGLGGLTTGNPWDNVTVSPTLDLSGGIPAGPTGVNGNTGGGLAAASLNSQVMDLINTPSRLKKWERAQQAATQFGIPLSQVESIMGWPTGSVDSWSKGVSNNPSNIDYASAGPIQPGGSNVIPTNTGNIDWNSIVTDWLNRQKSDTDVTPTPTPSPVDWNSGASNPAPTNPPTGGLNQLIPQNVPNTMADYHRSIVSRSLNS